MDLMSEKAVAFPEEYDPLTLTFPMIRQLVVTEATQHQSRSDQYLRCYEKML